MCLRFRTLSGRALALLVMILVLVSPPAQAQSALLRYKLSYRGTAYPGGALVLVQSFTSIDVTMDVRINAFLIRTDWDFLNATGRAFGLPLNVSGGQTKTLETILNLPSILPLGNHTIQVNVNWDYYYLYGGYWAGGNPIIFNSTFHVYSSSLGPFSLWGAGFEMLLWGFLTYLAIACSITLVFVYREEKRRKASY